MSCEELCLEHYQKAGELSDCVCTDENNGCNNEQCNCSAMNYDDFLIM